jgi:hypothetical protein
MALFMGCYKPTWMAHRCVPLHMLVTKVRHWATTRGVITVPTDIPGDEL